MQQLEVLKKLPKDLDEHFGVLEHLLQNSTRGSHAAAPDDTEHAMVKEHVGEHSSALKRSGKVILLRYV